MTKYKKDSEQVYLIFVTLALLGLMFIASSINNILLIWASQYSFSDTSNTHSGLHCMRHYLSRRTSWWRRQDPLILNPLQMFLSSYAFFSVNTLISSMLINQNNFIIFLLLKPHTTNVREIIFVVMLKNHINYRKVNFWTKMLTC